MKPFILGKHLMMKRLWHSVDNEEIVHQTDLNFPVRMYIVLDSPVVFTATLSLYVNLLNIYIH